MKRQMLPTEGRATTAAVYGPTCIGCQDHEADVMLSWTVASKRHPDPRDGTEGLSGGDLFLTWEQAAALHANLGRVLAGRPK